MEAVPRLLADRGLLVHAAGWSIAAALGVGLVTAIIPNPVFGRSVAPEPFAIWTWLLAAPLMGLALATVTAPVTVLPGVPAPVVLAPADPVADRRSSTLGGVASLGAFLAVGCPVCNKVALVLLGASGAMSAWAPLQPIVGAISLALLVATVAWRLRLRASGAACPA